jgi:hypothetical protein
MKWAGHVARMGVMTNTHFWSENLKGKDNLRDTEVDDTNFKIYL